jgi:hypothetical protein
MGVCAMTANNSSVVWPAFNQSLMSPFEHQMVGSATP